ncbi:Hypothetical predicted protein [Cloeon dipterum]|uniref:C-type lectin domain-containing protein n=1 Tax=Cloeon dipterum TaxID=197152 RepID=A0A8S1DK16_9INSE|nr:Hypothetical predicted protein [Cloeon dipterum]
MNSVGKASFTWINNATFNFTSWNTDFPTSNPKDYCVTITNGKWTNQRCININYFACEKSATITTSSKGCPATSSLYVLTRDQKSWDGARAACAQSGNGDLVTSETPEEDECVRTMIRQNGLESSYVWMSLNCINETFYDHWVTGANLSYRSWKSGEPSQYPTERCAIYWQNSWFDLPCPSPTYYVCEASLL